MEVYTHNHEQRPIERFGQKYQDYMTKTGKFSPRMSTNKEAMSK